ncbi:MAG: quinone oxidoreductase [Gammaproteobacteria bacterium]|nr:quinone oxidoreductase [Gammaproteobacteria bacterium]
MKAIRINQHGDASVLQLADIAIPTPGSGEALVRIKAAGINFADIYQREGRRPTPLPYTPGREGAGIVEAIGEGVTEVKVGDRVAYAEGIGSYAEFNLVKSKLLIPLPADMSFEQGAAFPLQGMTAHYLLHDFFRVKPNDKVLVHAAAGGVGLLLVQWLKHLGARVIGTVSTEEKAKIAREAGADHIILYTSQDFVEEAKRLTDGKGVDFIFDGVGKTTFTKDLEAIKTRGCIILFGSSSGPSELLAPNSLQAKSISICSGSLVNHIASREEILQRASDIFAGVREGWLKLRIDHVFTLEQAAEAQRVLEGRKTIGKIVLKIS